MWWWWCMDWLKGDSGVDNPVTKCFPVEGLTQKITPSGVFDAFLGV